MNDGWAVIRASGSEVAALSGCSDDGTMCASIAATSFARTSALIMMDALPARTSTADYPWEQTEWSACRSPGTTRLTPGVRNR